jgi:hypothetical protein
MSVPFSSNCGSFEILKCLTRWLQAGLRPNAPDTRWQASVKHGRLVFGHGRINPMRPQIGQSAAMRRGDIAIAKQRSGARGSCLQRLTAMAPTRCRDWQASRNYACGAGRSVMWEGVDGVTGSCATRRGRLILHFTPISASRLNLVERFFAEITQKCIRGASARYICERGRPQGCHT